ncbi:MAG: type II secretion system F family protein [Candidatus Nanohalobium sp.]
MDTTVSEKYLKYFLPAAEKLKPAVPSIKKDLKGARMDIDPDTYIANSLARAVQIGVSLSASIAVAGFVMHQDFIMKLGAGLLPLFTPLLFLTFAYRPKIKANRISRQLEKNLPYALRHMLIEVSSGVSMYEAMVDASYDYGEASHELNRIVSDIQGGKSQIKALEDSIGRNPSIMYRRAIWQMINALKSGADLTDTLNSLVDTMVEEQKLEVQKYGEDLNPFILMYLMLAVIFPSLGVTLMIVMSSFISLPLGKMTFYGMLGGLALFQLFFLNLVKSKRPEVKAA